MEKMRVIIPVLILSFIFSECTLHNRTSKKIKNIDKLINYFITQIDNKPDQVYLILNINKATDDLNTKVQSTIQLLEYDFTQPISFVSDTILLYNDYQLMLFIDQENSNYADYLMSKSKKHKPTKRYYTYKDCEDSLNNKLEIKCYQLYNPKGLHLDIDKNGNLINNLPPIQYEKIKRIWNGQ